ncbi:MAG: hypothetical protein PHH54_06245 [Candidatus Nanoarchaeia archaeon]|nr:hypothetical protein [Candidatus Nanoarchaeia archaeon]MDD5741555.1 hypothetical protein [Candidatus Nanoarchaeia archaeon]
MKKLLKRETVVMVVLTLVVFVLGFVSGCGTVNGVFQDVKTGATAISNQTQKLADKEEDMQQKMQEKDQVYHQRRAVSALEYQQEKDKANAESYTRATSKSNNR